MQMVLSTSAIHRLNHRPSSLPAQSTVLPDLDHTGLRDSVETRSDQQADMCSWQKIINVGKGPLQSNITHIPKYHLTRPETTLKESKKARIPVADREICLTARACLSQSWSYRFFVHAVLHFPNTRIWKTGDVITCNYSVITAL